MDCFNCFKTYTSLNELIIHIRKCYEEKEGAKNFLLSCVECGKAFRTFFSFKRHMVDHYSNETSNTKKRKFFDEEDTCTQEPESDLCIEKFIDNFHELITIMCSSCIAEQQQSSIISQVNLLLQNMRDVTLYNLKDNHENPIEATNISYNMIHEQVRIMQSKYLRQKNYKDHPYYVAPVEKSLTTRIDIQNKSVIKTSFEKAVQCTFQYVPIKDNLQKLFESETFTQQYLNGKTHVCTEGVYYDICCGRNVRNSEFFNANPNAAMIDLYYDEIEICDPLKQSGGVHKLGQIYYRIRNLNKNLQSMWSNIFLLASFYYADLHG